MCVMWPRLVALLVGMCVHPPAQTVVPGSVTVQHTSRSACIGICRRYCDGFVLRLFRPQVCGCRVPSCPDLWCCILSVLTKVPKSRRARRNAAPPIGIGVWIMTALGAEICGGRISQSRASLRNGHSTTQISQTQRTRIPSRGRRCLIIDFLAHRSHVAGVRGGFVSPFAKAQSPFLLAVSVMPLRLPPNNCLFIHVPLQELPCEPSSHPNRQGVTVT